MYVLCTSCNVVSLPTTSVNLNTRKPKKTSMQKHLSCLSSSIQSVDVLLLVHVPIIDTVVQSCIETALISTFGLLRARSSYRQVTICQCSLCYLLHFACICCLLAPCLLCFCSGHGPLIVRIAKLFRRVKGFNQLLHPSRCSQPLREPSVSVFSISDVGSFQLVECGVHGQQNTNPAILRCCCSTDAEIGYVPTSAHFFAVGTRLIVRSPSWTHSCPQKYLVSMCFVRGPAPKRSVKEFAVELSLCISTFIKIPISMYMDLKDSHTWSLQLRNIRLLLRSKLSSSAV